MKIHHLILTLVMLLQLSLITLEVKAAEGVLRANNIEIVVSSQQPQPVMLAIRILQGDFLKTMGAKPSIVGEKTRTKIHVIIANMQNKQDYNKYNNLSLNGFESHRVYSDIKHNAIYLLGADMRGTIYAIYTFSEKVLKVPPLWFYCSWKPTVRQQINYPVNLDYRFESPKVTYRSWFPNDTDLFTPWRLLSKDNNEKWLETMLRLKMNTVELEATVTYEDMLLSKEAKLLKKYGLILTSHHHVACNNNFKNWDGYWVKIRKISPPKLLLSNEKEMIEFWTYSIKTVLKSKQENLWQISFRGINDQPFWAAFGDAPKDEKSRAEVINRMLRIELNLIKKLSGEKDPYVRITFYDELSNMLSQGYLNPPKGNHIIWTFVAARRDHYPDKDLVNFKDVSSVKLGYYLNLQFTSTGAHLVPAEGPWKMECNYRYVMSKAPLYFSVVNAGNIREFLLSLSANASLLWNPESYSTDSFLEQFCSMYFGHENAKEGAKLYKEYFNAFWLTKQSDFPGMDRQYIFQDMRYARVFDQILANFSHYNKNPLHDIGFESVPGRSFRLQGSNQVDTLLVGTSISFKKFHRVRLQLEMFMENLPEQYRQFCYDNLYAYCVYMEKLNVALNEFLLAYSCQSNNYNLVEHLTKSLTYLEGAQNALLTTQHGVFTRWYGGERLWGFKNKIEAIKAILDNELHYNKN